MKTNVKYLLQNNTNFSIDCQLSSFLYSYFVAICTPLTIGTIILYISGELKEVTVTGQKIRELRKSLGVTQKDLAEGILSRSYLSQIEQGIVQPAYDTLNKIAGKLNCKVEDLFTEPENKPLIISELIRLIKHAESLILSGLFSQASRAVDNLNLKDIQALNDVDLGMLFWIKGKLLEKDYKWKAAADCFHESIEFLSKSTFFLEHIRSMDSLGNVLLQLERNEEALTILNKAYDYLIHNQIGGIIKTSVLINIGIAHGKLGEYHSAIRYLNYSHKINKATNTFFKEGQIFMSLGICYRRMSQLEKAEEYYLKALNFFTMTEEHSNIAGIYVNLGVLYFHLGNYHKSINSLLVPISMYEELNADKRLANARLELAQSLFFNGQDEEAKENCLQIITYRNESHFLGKAHGLLGSIEFSKNNYPDSLVHFLKACHYFQDNPSYLSEIVAKIAELYYVQNDFEKAAEYYRQLHRS
jgi:HTH-type transcriptional regulator, quorum sensing regulator NprR